MGSAERTTEVYEEKFCWGETSRLHMSAIFGYGPIVLQDPKKRENRCDSRYRGEMRRQTKVWAIGTGDQTTLPGGSTGQNPRDSYPQCGDKAAAGDR